MKTEPDTTVSVCAEMLPISCCTIML